MAYFECLITSKWFKRCRYVRHLFCFPVFSQFLYITVTNLQGLHCFTKQSSLRVLYLGCYGWYLPSLSRVMLCSSLSENKSMEMPYRTHCHVWNSYICPLLDWAKVLLKYIVFCTLILPVISITLIFMHFIKQNDTHFCDVTVQTKYILYLMRHQQLFLTN